MTAVQINEVLECADTDPHPEHIWGWRKRCPGRLEDLDSINYYRIERLAALYHDTFVTEMVDRGALTTRMLWAHLPKENRAVRIKAMTEVINDLKGRRT